MPSNVSMKFLDSPLPTTDYSLCDISVRLLKHLKRLQLHVYHCDVIHIPRTVCRINT